MRKLISLLLVALLFCSCSHLPQNKKLTVVATLFPQYDFCRQILGDDANVILLLPAGMESHNYQPSVKDIKAATDADLFIYTGAYMEPWAENIKQNAKKALDVSSGIELCEHKHSENEEHQHEVDPHIWTSPLFAQDMVKNILSAIVTLDKQNAQKYIARAEEYIAKLSALDKELLSICKDKQDIMLIHGGRFSLTYFASRYNLNFVAAFDSCSSHAEPSAKRVAFLIESLRKQEKRYVFYEELIQPRVAQTISDEADAQLLLLHSCHNVSKEELKNGVTYLQLMQGNLQNLKTVFGEENDIKG